MKFELRTGLEMGWVEVAASTIDFDGTPPLPVLRFQHPVDDGSIDRLVVASVLAFAPWVAGRCDFHKPFSALTAQRVGAWFQNQGVWVTPTPVRAGGLPIPAAHREATLTRDLQEGRIRLDVDEPFGMQSSSHRTLDISTNAAFVRQGGSPPGYELLPGLAVAVMVAERSAVGVIRDSRLAEINQRLFDSTAQLLESVSIGLLP